MNIARIRYAASVQHLLDRGDRLAALREAARLNLPRGPRRRRDRPARWAVARTRPHSRAGDPPFYWR